MLRKGQTFLITGMLLTIISMTITRGYLPDRKWIYIASDIFLIIATVLVIWGVVLVVRAKIKRR